MRKTLPPPRMLLLALAGLAAPALFAAEPGAPPPALSSSLRDRLDRLALKLPGDTLGGNVVRAVEEVPERVFALKNLAPEEEARRAADANARLLAARPAAVTPDAAQRVFDRLVKELPPHLKPRAFHYRLSVLDRPGRDAFTVGGGLVYITRPELDDLLADRGRGEAALAFVLADEIAHDALGHTRRGWLWQDDVDGAAGFLPIPGRAQLSPTPSGPATRRAGSSTRRPRGRRPTASPCTSAATPASTRTRRWTPCARPPAPVWTIKTMGKRKISQMTPRCFD